MTEEFTSDFHTSGMEAFIKGGNPPEWYRDFKEANKHLLSEDGSEFVFSIEHPLTIPSNGDTV